VACALVILLVAALASGTAALVPLLVAGAVPILAAPALSSARARRLATAVTLRAVVDPPMVAVGAPCRLRLTVEPAIAGGRRVPPLVLPSLARGWHRRAVDGPAPTSPGAPSTLAPRPALLLVPGREVTVPVPTARRGVLELPPTATWVRDPFGLFATPGPAVPGVIAVVHPDPEHDAALAAAALGGTRGGDPLGDLAGLRPYVPGDRIGLLHWPSRARTGTWQVRDFHPAAVDLARVLLDDRAGVHRRTGYETLLARTLGLIDEFLEQGRPVELATLTGGRYSFLPTATGPGDARRVLADLEPRPPAAPITAAVPGPVLTTATGAMSLPPAVAHPVVAA
jgi:uncharacterized protein (DUF58 family)